MELSDDLSPARRPLFVPVVLATVFLIIIGVSAGLALATWRGQGTTGNQGQNEPIPAVVQNAQACRPETQNMGARANASGTLRIALLVRTRTSAIWICRDGAGQLFYHANRGGESADWVEGVTALFLTGVRRDGDEYAVKAADGTVFELNSDRLRIIHKDGREEIQDAV
ncbi:hypothetical protein [Krasilnikovia cinnamomea]|uniref:hypothetical protein n=1 Tax=Krasilnikovia cinnamomea TaxID=349313 RepID=UPI001F5EAD80|nr:hypothetical protein [Krasilnikovia cinnamomea]